MLLIISLILIASVSTTASADRSMSASDVLRSHGLPIGLLPDNIRNFTIDDSGSSFKATIDVPCTAKFESGSDVRYDRNISGNISYARLTSLSGISAQELFLWFPVREIRVDVPSSGLIYFDVGVIFKQFSLSLFDTPPNCVPTSKLSGASIARESGKKLRFEELDQAAAAAAEEAGVL